MCVTFNRSRLINLVSRVLSPLTATPSRSLRKDLAAAGHVASRFWELARKSIRGRVRRNSLSHKNVSSKEIFPFLAQSSTFQKSSTENGNHPVINISIYRKYWFTKCQVTNVNMCPGVLLFRLSDGYKRY